MRVPETIRKFLRAMGLVYLPALTIIEGFRVFVALKVGVVRFIGQDHLLTYQAEPFGFVLAVAFYALVSALCFGLFVFWFVERPLRPWPSIALTGAILFGIFAGVSLAPVVAQAPVIMAPLFGKGPVIERPPPVQALVARLQTSRPFQALEDKPVSCGAVPKHHGVSRCYYSPAGLEMMVSWRKLSGEPRFFSLEKREPRDASPFAWADLPLSFHLLCPELTPEQAAALADDALDRLRNLSWTEWGNGEVVVSPDAYEAGRRVTVRQGACRFDLIEATRAAQVRATLRASFRRS
jgi:hypothetical protein